MARLLLASLAAAVAAAHSTPHRMSLLNYTHFGVAPRLGSAGTTSTATVSASPSVIVSDGNITVKFTNSQPASSDLIVAYSPASAVANLSSFAPVEYFYATASPGYAKSGKGSLTFRLPNLRADVAFVLVVGGLTNPQALAVSPPITFKNLNEPRAPRLVMRSGEPGTMLVTWTSAVTTGSPRVVVTPAGGGAQATFPATSVTYGAADMCGEPATGIGFRDPGAQHTAVMTGLVPGDSYSYSVGDDSELSAPFEFVQPSGGYPYGIAAYGDEGQRSEDGSTIIQDFAPAPNTSALVGEWIKTAGAGVVQSIHHVGDISYARGYAASWDFFLAMNSPLFTTTPYYVDMGNHEESYMRCGGMAGARGGGGKRRRRVWVVEVPRIPNTLMFTEHAPPPPLPPPTPPTHPTPPQPLSHHPLRPLMSRRPTSRMPAGRVSCGGATPRIQCLLPGRTLVLA